MRFVFAALLLGASLLPAATLPRPASDVTINVPGKGPVKLSQYKGKVVVLEIMSTTCPHCQNSSVILSRLNTEMGAKGLQPLGMAINPGADVPGFIKAYGVNFPVGTGSRDEAFAVAQHSMMSGTFYYPTMLFIDRKGMVRAQYNGTDAFLQNNETDNVRKLVQQLLAEPAGAKAVPKKAAPAGRKR